MLKRLYAKKTLLALGLLISNAALYCGFFNSSVSETRPIDDPAFMNFVEQEEKQKGISVTTASGDNLANAVRKAKKAQDKAFSDIAGALKMAKNNHDKAFTDITTALKNAQNSHNKALASIIEELEKAKTK